MINPAIKENNDMDISNGIKVLETEIKGLQALANSLDEDFTKAIETIDKMKNKRNGRLIIAGIGKSGHVAKKIAATLASTGTPSYFVHPGEASHGDLGMITENDIVIMLSNSGENSELSDLIAYTRRFNICLICITSNSNSTLAKHSDIKLVMPKMPEACPNQLAPTTSTTMMMALGDAIAISLLERMGLTSEDFKIFHPGGKLGQKLLKVSEIMLKDDALPIVSVDTTMDKAIIKMTEKNTGSLIIADDNNEIIGIITDGDLKRHMNNDLLQKKVSEIMSTNPKTISPDMLAVEALDIMLNKYKQPITSLIVAKNGKISGLLRIQECLTAGIA